MRRTTLALSGLVLFVLFVFLGCECPPAEVAPRAGHPPAVSSLTLDEKVGQLFLVGARGIFMNDASPAFAELVRQVEELRVGGVIWFASDVYETAVLNQKLQARARIPLLVAADLEAGAGMRFDHVMYGPWPMAVAAAGDVSLAEQRARATAEEARALGVNQVYAPVADVNVNPDNPVINVRSFGEDPADVARFVAATVKGLQEGGVLATLKHFPGHGDTAVDSHRSLPVLHASRERIESVELVPFREGIRAGAAAVMVAHLAAPALDATAAPPLRDATSGGFATRLSPDAPEVTASEFETKSTLPASLSKAITTGLLRKELGFGGLVVTDAMDMGGIAAYFSPGEAAVRAIEAGADLVLKSPDTRAAVAAVVAAVKEGRIPEARIDESVGRVFLAKERLGLFRNPVPVTAPFAGIGKTVGSPEHERVEKEIARRALTLVREAPGALPLSVRGLVHIAVGDEVQLHGPEVPLSDELARRFPKGAPRTVSIDPRSTPEDVRAAVEAARGADAILLTFYVRARSGSGQISVPAPGKAVAAELLALGKPVVAVSFGNPYLLLELPGLPTYVCAYGTQDVVQVAALAALLGEAPFTGRLPVTIPGLAPRGTGIQRAASASPSAPAPPPGR